MSAEKAAHFTSTFDVKPSIFEVIAQNSLNFTLHPALSRIADFIVSCNPEKLDWIRRNYDEIFFVVNSLLQHHYLKNYNASFSEYFYNLRRAPVAAESTDLSNKDKKLSFLLLVVLPYLLRKLDRRIDYFRLQNAEGALKKDFTGYFKKLLIFCNSTFSSAWATWILTNYLLYMTNKVESQHPQLKIVNLKLVYLTDVQDLQGYWIKLFKGQLSWPEFSKGFLSNLVYSTFEVGAFVTQFLQVWNTEHSAFNLEALPTPSPPKIENDNFKNMCPICLDKWKIPTVLPVSGYVFCFSCILRHLREKEKCPVTNLPARPHDVVRLYVSD